MHPLWGGNVHAVVPTSEELVVPSILDPGSSPCWDPSFSVGGLENTGRAKAGSQWGQEGAGCPEGAGVGWLEHSARRQEHGWGVHSAVTTVVIIGARKCIKSQGIAHFEWV